MSMLALIRRIWREGRFCPLAHRIPAHTLDDFNRERDERQTDLPFPVVAKDRREMEERFGWRQSHERRQA